MKSPRFFLSVIFLWFLSSCYHFTSEQKKSAFKELNQQNEFLRHLYSVAGSFAGFSKIGDKRFADIQFDVLNNYQRADKRLTLRLLVDTNDRVIYNADNSLKEARFLETDKSESKEDSYEFKFSFKPYFYTWKKSTVEYLKKEALHNRSSIYICDKYIKIELFSDVHHDTTSNHIYHLLYDNINEESFKVNGENITMKYGSSQISEIDIDYVVRSRARFVKKMLGLPFVFIFDTITGPFIFLYILLFVDFSLG